MFAIFLQLTFSATIPHPFSHPLRLYKKKAGAPPLRYTRLRVLSCSARGGGTF